MTASPPGRPDQPAGGGMVLTVAAVAGLAAGLLGVVQSQTAPLIAASRMEEKTRALRYILPDFDNRPFSTGAEVEMVDGPQPRRARLYTATLSGETVGFARELTATEGFGPRIDLLVSATLSGRVSGVYVLGHQETPGLGAKMTEGQTQWKEAGSAGGKPFILQFADASTDSFDFRVRKDGGEVDAITASTITSRAVSRAVERALRTIDAQTAGPGE